MRSSKFSKISTLSQKVSKIASRHPKVLLAITVMMFSGLGLLTLRLSRAATPYVSLEPENGSIQGCISSVDDSNASGKKAIMFGCESVSSTGAGAKLPIQYDINKLTGTIRYVATTGTDSNPGTKTAPFATLAMAAKVSNANDTIVVRGGIYRGQANVSLDDSGLKVIAYPGETPVFNGATDVTGANGWTQEGVYSYRSYSPRPVTNGGGVNFSSSNTNLVDDGVGRYPDQAWIGDKGLKQVMNKSSLSEGEFFVDRSNNRLYMMASDTKRQGIEISRSAKSASERDRMLTINGKNITVEGLKIIRYSASAGDYGGILVAGGASGSKITNVELSDFPYEGIHYATGNVNSVTSHVTINRVGWQSINTDRTDNYLLDYAKITHTDPFDEFTSSPASGAIKTSRNRNTKITNGLFTNNNSHGIWFDQSNINSVVANNTLIDNIGASVFFEISDGFIMANNYVRAKGSAQAVKLAGSSGISLVNNTIIGGVDPIGVYTDARSIPGCSTRPSSNPCQLASEVQTYFPVPSTMDWMPRIDLMINNIVAYPSGSTFCGGTEPVCIMTYHGSTGASYPIEKIIHKADPSRGIPQTVMNGNVYVNGSGAIIRVSQPVASYSNVSSWTSAMAKSPVGITGIDSLSKFGNEWVQPDGTPTAALKAVHNQAIAVPSNSLLNQYVPAGNRHYGVLNK